MNLVEAGSIDLFPAECRNRHALRRLRAGELVGEDAARLSAHAAGCARCARIQRELEAEDAAVRAAVPLEKLQARLEDAAAAKVVPLRRISRAAPVIALALAAGIAGLVLAPRLASRQVAVENRTKGGLGLEVYVGGVGEPRRVDGREVALGAGENVRLKVHGNGHRYVAVVSVDENGQVSPIYFSNGESLPLAGAEELLPQSIAFDGRGRERLVVLFSDGPLARDAVESAAQRAFEKSGGLSGMGRLGLEGVEELDRTVLKPGSP